MNEEEQVMTEPEKEPEREQRFTGLYEWVEAAVFSLIVVVLVFTFLFRVVGVDGPSMTPTLLDQERLILTDLFYTPERGDIVVINRYTREPLIKRIIAVGGDTFAYFVGNAIGGPKLCPHISPNKTVAGAVGGLVGSILCAVLAGRIFSWCFPYFAGFPPIWGDMLAGLFGGVAGQMGDLFASMVKRHCKVKDFGHIFPGHGGMLDRLDSILFTAIIIYCYRVILRTRG